MVLDVDLPLHDALGLQVAVINGVGPGGTRAGCHSPTLTVFMDDCGSRTTEVPVCVVAPVPAQPGDRDCWLLPSLLGGDLLRLFDLFLGGDPLTVTLTE